jgi:DNA-binding CsgD family transcriptional regulator
VLRLLIDTSAWLDLAMRRDGQKWIVPLRVFLHQGKLELLVPPLVIEESEHNRPRSEDTARRGGFLHTVVTTAPGVTSYLVQHSKQLRADSFTEQLTGAALQACASQPEASRSRRLLIDPLTAAELRILKLLPTSSYPQMAATLYLSRNTVKTHLRSIYRKLGVTSRTQAIQRAIDLRLL